MLSAPAAEQRLSAGSLPRHRHGAGYAALVLAGGYLEAGDAGRWQTEPGDIVVHAAFEAHLDVVPSGGAAVLNVPLPAGISLPAVFRVGDFDTLVHAARTDLRAASALLVPAEARPPSLRDWPDLLARDLRAQPDLALGAWATAAGLAPATVSRGFAAAFGTTPARYRAEARARTAWRRIVLSDEPFAAIAHDCGFADQAHLTRAVSALTASTPSAWRKVKSVQDSRDHSA